MSHQRIYTIELQDLALGYNKRILLEHAAIGFGWGELTGLIGRNGTGKSTLLRTMAGVMKPLQGKVLVQGESMETLTQKRISEMISFVSTDRVDISNLKVVDVVGLGRAPYTNWIGRLTDHDRDVVYNSLALVGMNEYAEHGINTLSDGERQRVMIARALAQDTPIILLDEPTAFLDLPNKYEICLLLRELAHREGKCIIFSTHDLSIALELCDTLAMIQDRKFYYGTAEKMIQENEIQQLFNNTPLYFDRQSLTVKLVSDKG